MRSGMLRTLSRPSGLCVGMPLYTVFMNCEGLCVANKCSLCCIFDDV